ncbi:zinc finger protein CONSTANS-LIKE 16-like [Lotus japonicus]|uniref:zinc finger protein CONSTANS-LIKE 16-like n=1 Tax=Lotus japonicus TaxID=34305 RepID=UPI00258F7EA7|nr:zinc finger protein CONSTANS-LIKE 16-like [Lotus japonicus]
MMSEMKGAASALGAKTARACDSCLKVRARWYCAADDAFLCHGCDNSVHSANQLASRHERVRLQSASSSKVKKSSQAQAWHSGFTRKARTPRHNNKHQQQRLKNDQQVLFNNNTFFPLVPELGSEETLLHDETDEELLCLVPVFDGFDEGLCSIYKDVKDERLENTTIKSDVGGGGDGEEKAFDLENFSSHFLPSDMDLAEFAADVESLLGEDSLKGSELVNCKDELGGAMVKVKDEELDADVACHLDSILEMNSSEVFDWNFESESLVAAEEEEKVAVPLVESRGAKKKIFLRLNYEEVIAAWDSQGSPWTTPTPPQFNSDDCWPDFLGSSGANVQCCYGEVRSLTGQAIGGGVDGGREARVSRYREKRRTRLFAKKIRYEVRKLNAEKRPRMKGRFVKRT